MNDGHGRTSSCIIAASAKGKENFLLLLLSGGENVGAPFVVLCVCECFPHTQIRILWVVRL